MTSTAYDPPASELMSTRAAAERAGVKHHTVNQAVRAGYLWAINLGAGQPAYYTTLEAVRAWQSSGRFRGGYT